MGEEEDGAAYFGVVFVFNPPEADVLVLVAVVELELEPEPLEPQPAASSSAEQAIRAATMPRFIGWSSFLGGFTYAYHLIRHGRSPTPRLDFRLVGGLLGCFRFDP